MITCILLGTTSCSSISAPLDSEFKRIANKEYVLNKYDCSNMSAEYLDSLHAKGFTNSRIWTYVTPMFKGYSVYMGHAIVEVDGIFYDPTSGSSITGFKAELIREQSTARTISYEELQELKKSNPREWDY